jgi:hypothetical protein
MRQLLLLPIITLAALPAYAAPASPSREVLVLYSDETKTALRGETPYSATETVLNHLGLVARHHNLSQGLPEGVEGLRGIISLIDAPATRDPAAYAAWLSARLDAGQPVYLLGGLANLLEAYDGRSVPAEGWRGVLRRLGLKQEGDAPDESVKLTPLPGPHAGYEAGYKTPPFYVPMQNQDPANTVFLRERREDTGETTDLAVMGPKGALATSTACLFETNPMSFRLRWRVDPFWLFSGLKLPGEPALDPTTESGRRVFFAHIDGDGFANRAILRGAPYSAEVVKDQVLSRTWLPTTVSVVAREIVGKPDREAIARALFRLPHVQAGSHTYTHPHDWELGIGTPEGMTGDTAEALAKAPKEVIDPVLEVDKSIRYIETLLPKNRKVEVMLWSGMTNPTVPVFERTAALGVPNLNGGDAMLAPGAPSYANLAPFGHRVGAHWQIYSAAANENIFTNLWTGPFDGQRAALDLFRFSGAPRRLSAVNIYYHFYAAERLAGLKTLQTLYRWAESQPLCHVTTAHYSRLVEGFYAGHVTPDGPDAWRVKGAGACRTLRFDHERRAPDLGASSGVAGYNYGNGSLYVHLSTPDARVVLAARPIPTIRLESASAPVLVWKREARGLTGTFDGSAPVSLTLAGFTPGQSISLKGDFRGPAKADRTGRVALTAPPGRDTLEVRW